MTDQLFEDKKKNETMPPNIVNLHNSLFSCYSQSANQDDPNPENSAPKIGVRVSNFDDDADVVTAQDGIAVTDFSKFCGNIPFQISHKFSCEADNERRASQESDETIG